MNASASGSSMVADPVGAAIETAVRSRRRVVDSLSYEPASDTLVVGCGPLTLSIDIKSIPELAGIPRDEVRLITLSAGGATIMIESANVYIKSAALMLSELERIIKNNKPGNLIIDILQDVGKRHQLPLSPR